MGSKKTKLKLYRIGMRISGFNTAESADEAVESFIKFLNKSRKDDKEQLRCHLVASEVADVKELSIDEHEYVVDDLANTTIDFLESK